MLAGRIPAAVKSQLQGNRRCRALTKDARELPEAEREPAYDRQLSAASWQARLVKLADVYDNFCDARDEKERAKFAEKAKRAIRCAGDAPELQQAVEIVRKLVGG